MLPLAYANMSQLCPLPLPVLLELEHCWSVIHLQKTVVIAVRGPKLYGLIPLLLWEQHSDKMDRPLAGGRGKEIRRCGLWSQIYLNHTTAFVLSF